jgi:hypothetical protein
MKFHRIKPTISSLQDPYNQRMVSHTEEEGFVTNEVQADHLIRNNLAVMIEANVPSPTAPQTETPVAAKSKMKKVVTDDDLT